MCILFHKVSTKHEIITVDMLKDMWSSNPHGAGFAFRKTLDKGSWEVAKGFMSQSDMLEFWKEIAECEEIVGHLRYATHGAKTPENCHPFAIAQTLQESTSLQPKTGLRELFFHNGVLSEFGDRDTSDSADFCVRVLSPMACQARPDILASVTGKFVYIDSDGDVHLVGDFTKHVDGLMVSNTYWDKSRMFHTGKIPSRYNGSIGFREAGHLDHNSKYTPSTQSVRPYGSGVDDADYESSLTPGNWKTRFDADTMADMCGGCRTDEDSAPTQFLYDDHGNRVEDTVDESHSVLDEDGIEQAIMIKRYDELCYQFDELNELIDMLDDVEDADDIKKYMKQIDDIEQEIGELDPYIDAEESEYLRDFFSHEDDSDALEVDENGEPIGLFSGEGETEAGTDDEEIKQ